MMMSNITPATRLDCDRALAALRAAHPDGPPADVFEPSEPFQTVFCRMSALELFGAVTAPQVFPHLFPDPRWRAGS
ncbi:hypothetical protein [Roseibium alexandrii]|uniref:hypothetical protein n=1 Tax=Roseibium alexandrii TaxID=388408 RepID=UPI0037525160